jgi:hypothetical protein
MSTSTNPSPLIYPLKRCETILAMVRSRTFEHPKILDSAVHYTPDLNRVAPPGPELMGFLVNQERLR